jgi:hypothetical protein
MTPSKLLRTSVIFFLAAAALLWSMLGLARGAL